MTTNNELRLRKWAEEDRKWAQSPEGKKALAESAAINAKRQADMLVRQNQMVKDFAASMQELCNITPDQLGAMTCSTVKRDREFATSVFAQMREGREPTAAQIAVLRKIAAKTEAIEGAAIAFYARVKAAQ